MLNSFMYLLCSKLCWHNQLVPIKGLFENENKFLRVWYPNSTAIISEYDAVRT